MSRNDLSDRIDLRYKSLDYCGFGDNTVPKVILDFGVTAHRIFFPLKGLLVGACTTVDSDGLQSKSSDGID